MTGLEALCRAMVRATHSAVKFDGPEDGAELIGTLARGLAMAIVTCCKGDPKGISTMMEGTVQHVFEECSRMKPLGDMLGMPRAGANWHRPRRFLVFGCRA